MQHIKLRIKEKFTKKDNTNYKFSINRIDKILSSIFVGLNSQRLENRYLIDNLNKWFIIKEIKKEMFYHLDYDKKNLNINVSNDFLLNFKIIDNRMILKNIIENKKIR